MSGASRHTSPVFPSQLFTTGSVHRWMFFTRNTGFHLAASRSSAPGSVPTGVHSRRKYLARVGGMLSEVLKPVFCHPCRGGVSFVTSRNLTPSSDAFTVSRWHWMLLPDGSISTVNIRVGFGSSYCIQQGLSAQYTPLSLTVSSGEQVTFLLPFSGYLCCMSAYLMANVSTLTSDTGYAYTAMS